MINKDFVRFDRLKMELQRMKHYCPNQYGPQKCKSEELCKRQHVDRCFYPCIHYYMGNCKYGFNCHFSHSIKRLLVRPPPKTETCSKLYLDNYCPLGNKCKYSHDLKGYPCVFNSLDSCKYDDETCRYSHKEKMEVPVVCFFSLMNGCNNKECKLKHDQDSLEKFITYDGPIN